MSGPSSHFPDVFLNDSYNIPYNNIPHISHSENNILNHVHASEPLSSHSFSIITSASHEVLIRSGNAAYALVNARHLEAKCELQAQRNLVAQLQDVITKLTSLRHPQVPSTSDMAPNQDKTDSLNIPGPLQPLNRVDYPYVLFWCDEDWVKYADDERNRGEVPSRLGFLTDEDGSPVPESRIKTFMSTAKQAWNELYRLRLDPKSWTKTTPKAASYLAHIMKTSFDEFRYCDGDWKVERFAIIKYPDWCHDAREPGRLTCARPSKRKNGDGNSVKDGHRRKKAKITSTMPPGAQVVDLDAPTSPAATAAPNLPSTSATPPPDLTPEVSAPSPSSDHAPHPSAIAPPARICTASPQPAPSPPMPSAPPPCVPDPTPAPTANAPLPPSTADVPIQDPSSHPLSERNAGVPHGQTLATVDVATSSLDPGRQGQPRRVVNPLAGLSIRKPSIQVAEEEPRNAPSGEAEPTSTSRRSDKLMVASSTALSARNLFAIEYLKEHPMTTKPQFKKVWDNIASKTKKKYETLSKERKSATRLPTAASANGSSAD